LAEQRLAGLPIQVLAINDPGFRAIRIALRDEGIASGVEISLLRATRCGLFVPFAVSLTKLEKTTRNRSAFRVCVGDAADGYPDL